MVTITRRDVVRSHVYECLIVGLGCNTFIKLVRQINLNACSIDHGTDSV